MKKTVLTSRFFAVTRVSFAGLMQVNILGLAKQAVAGQLIGPEAVAGISVMLPVATLLSFLGNVIGTGTTMLASYAQGRGDRQEVNRLYSQGLVMCIAGGLFMTALLVVLREPFLSGWLGTGSAVRTHADAYYKGLLLLPLPVLLSSYFFYFSVEEGMESVSYSPFIVSLVLSVILGYRFGTYGIVLSTLAATVLEVWCNSSFLRNEKCLLKFSKGLELRSAAGTMLRGSYTSVGMFCLALFPLFTTRFIAAEFGDDHIVVLSCVMSVLTLVISFSLGISDALQPMICQYYAEGNHLNVRKIMGQCLETIFLLSGSALIVTECFAEVLPLVFGVTDPEIAAASARALRVIAVFMPVLSFLMVISTYYVFMVEAGYGVAIQLVTLLVLPYLFLRGFSFRMGNDGIWIGTGAAYTTALVLFLLFARYLDKSFGHARDGLFLLDKRNMARQISLDCSGTETGVLDCLDEADRRLREAGIPALKRTKAELLMEEIGMAVVEYERGRESWHSRDFQIEFTLFPGEKPEDALKLVIRDNAEARDIGGEDEMLASMREYVAERVAMTTDRRLFLPNGHENRQVFYI